jgi:hypothetical protein
LQQFFQETVLPPKGEILFFAHVLKPMSIAYPGLTMAILLTPLSTTFCSSHTVIMAGTVIFFIALPSAQTLHHNGNPHVLVKLNTLRFAYTPVMVNTPQFIKVVDSFSNKLSTCGRPQIKRALRSSGLTKAISRLHYTVAWKIG